MKRTALFLVATAWVGVACAPEKEGPVVSESPPIAVRTAKVRREAIAQPIVGTGVLSSKAEMKAAFRLGGIIAHIKVDEGDRVKRGQVVATMRATEVQAAVEQANQALTKAERDLARAKTLYDGNAATKEQLDDATTAVAISRSQVRAARFNQDNMTIRAPADGLVLRRLAEPNELVGPGQPVLILSIDGAGWVVRVSLADRDVVRITEETPAQVELSAWPGVQMKGVVSEIASAATLLGTYEIEIAVTPPRAEQERSPEAPPAPEPITLRSGMIGRIRIDPKTSKPVTLIPASALRDGEGKTATVWAPQPDGRVAPFRVKVAFFLDDLVALSEGLETVEEVITDGAAYLNTYSKVRIIEGAEGTGAAAPAVTGPKASATQGRTP
ncbi:MAG: efflux RND transporter periplasmic adaptor subunit [Kofleriaceae bacterium]